jgi:uncharacterized membrane protein YhfC
MILKKANESAKTLTFSVANNGVEAFAVAGSSSASVFSISYRKER